MAALERATHITSKAYLINAAQLAGLTFFLLARFPIALQRYFELLDSGFLAVDFSVLDCARSSQNVRISNLWHP